MKIWDSVYICYFRKIFEHIFEHLKYPPIVKEFSNIFLNILNAPLSGLSWKTKIYRPKDLRTGPLSICPEIPTTCLYKGLRVKRSDVILKIWKIKIKISVVIAQLVEPLLPKWLILCSNPSEDGCKISLSLKASFWGVFRTYLLRHIFEKSSKNYLMGF